MDLLEECLLNRVPVNVADKTGNTPLHCASRTGQLACLERLLNVVPSVNVNAQNRENKSSYILIKTVELLCRHPDTHSCLLRLALGLL